jgi:hypothetical protein
MHSWIPIWLSSPNNCLGKKIKNINNGFIKNKLASALLPNLSDQRQKHAIIATISSWQIVLLGQ